MDTVPLMGGETVRTLYGMPWGKMDETNTKRSQPWRSTAMWTNRFEAKTAIYWTLSNWSQQQIARVRPQWGRSASIPLHVRGSWNNRAIEGNISYLAFAFVYLSSRYFTGRILRHVRHTYISADRRPLNLPAAKSPFYLPPRHSPFSLLRSPFPSGCQKSGLTRWLPLFSLSSRRESAKCGKEMHKESCLFERRGGSPGSRLNSRARSPPPPPPSSALFLPLESFLHRKKV